MSTDIDDARDPGPSPGDRPPAAVVGAGLGGPASAMRLGAKGYRVTVFDRLSGPGGRGSSLERDGHRFDLGPTIVTVPQFFRELWAACGRCFDDDVDLRALDPFYEIRWPDGSRFVASQDEAAMCAEVARLSPSDLRGYQRFLADSERRYRVGFEDLVRRSMHHLTDLVKVLPTFAFLRAYRSVHGHAARRVKDERLLMALSFYPLFIWGDPFHVTSMYTLVSHLAKAFGFHYAMGGVDAKARAMVRVIESQGGCIRQEIEVSEVLLSRGRASGLRIADGTQVRADIVVSNADAGHTYNTLSGKTKRRRWSSAKLGRTRWSMRLFVWYLGARGTRGMWSDGGHHTIRNGPRYKGLVEDIFIKRRLAEEMSLYVHRSSVTDPGAAPPDGDTFYALRLVPHPAAGLPGVISSAEVLAPLVPAPALARPA